MEWPGIELSRDDLVVWYLTALRAILPKDGDVLTLLPDLNGAGVPWGIVTNGNSFQHATIRSRGLEGLTGCSSSATTSLRTWSARECRVLNRVGDERAVVAERARTSGPSRCACRGSQASPIGQLAGRMEYSSGHSGGHLGDHPRPCASGWSATVG